MAQVPKAGGAKVWFSTRAKGQVAHRPSPSTDHVDFGKSEEEGQVKKRDKTAGWRKGQREGGRDREKGGGRESGESARVEEYEEAVEQA